jgi:hypothetical protein
MITKTKQKWEAGQTVKVGFMSLRVVSSRTTPNDYLPDAYLLESKGKFYEFLPHNGLSRVDDTYMADNWGAFANV